MDGRAAGDGRSAGAPGSAGDSRAADAELAVAVAGRAAELLRTVRRSAAGDLGAEGDRQSHDLIVGALREARPADAIRSEEAPADHPGDGSGRLWIVDPLDGTREFAEGRPEFAVHVALVVDGDPVLGAVALPALGTVLSSAEPPVPAPWTGGVPRLAVSRSRPPAVAGAVATALGAELVPLGSAGFKIAAVVRGEVDAYVHAGGQYEWDSAAPVAVALAAGLHASRIDGSPLRYGRADPWLPDLVVCRPELRDRVLAALSPPGGEA